MIINSDEFKLLALEGKVVGITSGCFDLLHFCHLRYLELIIVPDILETDSTTKIIDKIQHYEQQR